MKMTLCKIPCCICGTMIVPNGANQCSSCLAQDFDLRGELHGNKDELIIHQCRECRRYEQQSVKTSSRKNAYRYMEWESPQLLALCLKSIPGLNTNNNQQQPDSKNKNDNNSRKRFQLLDAIWVWTEPHSKRLKVRVTIKTEVHNVPVQQRLIVEFRIQWQQCPECKREYTNRTWHALVQVRQKRGDVNVGGSSISESSNNNHSNYHNHNTALAKLEMGIYNNPAIRKHVLEIDTTKNGFDFYFLKYNQAQAFANFVTKISPCKKIKTTSKLISTDSKNNTANMKHTITCDIVPMCKHDLICITKSVAHAGGGGHHLRLCGKLALITNITNNIHMVDVSPSRNVIDVKNKCMSELSADHYFKIDKHAIPILLTSSRMIKFVVLDVELLSNENNHDHQLEQNNHSSNKNHHLPYALAEVQVMREIDFGVNDEILTCVSHLGNILQSGDTVLGYDIINNPILVEELESNNSLHSNYVLPDIVLVKKLKPEKTQKSKKKKRQQQQRQQQNNVGRTLEVVKEDAEEDFDPVLSKKEKRRLQKQQKKNKNNVEGKKGKRKNKREPKRMRELIQSAERMGFIGENEEHVNKDGNDNDNEYINDSDDDNNSNDDKDENDVLLDKNLLADLDALQNDLEQIVSSTNSNNNE